MSKKTNTAKPLIECPKCGGSGEVELGDELMEVLRVTAGMRKITAPAVFKRLNYQGSSPFAINNRLTELKRLGFYSRRREGRTFVYKQIRF